MPILERFFEPPSEARFARRLTSAIRRAGEPDPIHVDFQGFRIVTTGAQPNVLHLQNLYLEYRVAPRAQRPAMLQSIVRSWFDRYKEIPSQYDDLGPDLLPAIRPRSYLEAQRLEALVKGNTPLDIPYRTLGDDHALCLVYDLPQSMLMVQERHLTTWDVHFNEALVMALENLKAMSPPAWTHPVPGVLASAWHDHYDASRLPILPELIDLDDLAGSPVVMIPNRDTLLMAGSADEAGLKSLARLANEALSRPRPMHGQPLTLMGDRWIPYTPDADHPCASIFNQFHARAKAHHYQAQANLLNQVYHDRGDDSHLAGYFLHEPPEAWSSLSYCVWVEGSPTLLPETDRVYFVRTNLNDPQEQNVVAQGTWNQVVQVVGHLMTPQGTYPERYRVDSFPTLGQINELNARAATGSKHART